MAFPPEGYLIGAEKCGTTTLTDLLAQHPALCVSSPRDSDFFSRNFAKGFDWYRTLFPESDGKVLLDVSLSYTMAPLTRMASGDACSDSHLIGVPERIHAVRPDARFIYIVRDPVTRTYSSYWHAVRYGYKDRGFRKALEEASGFLDTSDYAGQLDAYLRWFPPESFLLIPFEEMKRDPVMAAQRCFAFLGVEPGGFTPEFERARNVSFRYNGFARLVRSVMPSGDAMNRLVNIGQALTPGPLQPFAKRLITDEIPPLSDEDRAFLIKYFRPRNARLSEMLNVSTADWQH